MSRVIEHSFIEPNAILEPEKYEEPPSTMQMLDAKLPLYDEVVAIGDLSKPNSLEEAFNIKTIGAGTLYVSKKSYVRDLEGRLVPRTMLITNTGKELFRKNPGLLKQLDQQTSTERLSKIDAPSSYGVVRIVDTKDGGSVAIKRFRRYEDGRKLHIGGLEQAEVYMELNEMLSEIHTFHCRLPTIYMASQDVMVMENIENMQSLEDFVENHKDIESEVWQAVKAIDKAVAQAFSTSNLKGFYEPLVFEASETELITIIAQKHLFIEDYNEETQELKFVLIDPNSSII